MSHLLALPNISTRDRVLRSVWRLAWWLIFRPTPIMLHGWRRRVLRTFGARIEGRVYVYPDVDVWAPWNLDMAQESCLGPGVVCYNVALVRLGRGVTVSQRAHLCTASHDFDDPAFPLTGAPITLEDGAWIAAEAFIGPGVTIGAQAVVLARSVVARHVVPNAVMAGNPARKIRDRSTIPGDVTR